MSNTEAFILGK